MNRQTLIFILAAAGLAIIWFSRNGMSGIFPGGPEVQTGVTTSTLSGGKPSIKADTGGSHPGLTYAQAALLYVDRRMQFGADCSANPDSLFVQNGSTVMFDNLAPAGIYISLDGARYYLRASDFRILVPSAETIPHTVAVSCGGRIVGHITLN